jgi:ubiquinone/menaquinone biosynthesis C-methylase UbiE
MNPKQQENQEWYQRWFNQVYTSLYSHRNQEQAEKQVGALLSAIENVTSIQKVLDIACGGGRHVSALHTQLHASKDTQGIQVIGMDLSWDLLQTMEKEVRIQNTFLRGNMKHLPFPTQCFDLVTSFFSSYGYFKTPEEDKQALAGMLAPLKTEGFFFLDLVNKETVLQNLVSQDSKDMGDWHVIQKRHVEKSESPVIVKDIYLHPLSNGTREPGEPHHYQERLRVYSQEEMETLFKNWGFEICHIFGSEEGEPFNKKGSPRMSFLVQKK